MNDFFHTKRIIVLAVFVFIAAAYITLRYVRLALTPVAEIAARTPVMERGAIVDRSGKPLAVQTNFYHVGVTPKMIADVASFAKDVASILDMKEGEVASIIENAKGAHFVYLKKKIGQTAYDELQQIIDTKGYTFVRCDRIPGRVYPENSLASQLVGYMGDDGNGLSGTEYSMQSTLAPSVSSGSAQMEPGKNVYLTIDANLQYKLEQIASNAMKNTQAESMMLVAAEAKTGEILSYISLPSVNLNEYGKATVDETIDRPAMTAYEPGSVFKIFTVAILYDAGLIHSGDSFFCNGMYEKKTRSGETLRIKCLGTHGWVTPRDALRLSCNAALGQMSDRIDEDEFIEKIRALGFGRRTGIELPGETAGSVKDPNSRSWSARSKPTIAIGQEISVSALQMMYAATSLASGGIPVKLTTIKRITNKDGSTYYEHKAERGERALSEATAHYLLSCMETTATTGTGSRARLGDISIGVKTGTAQMADKSGGYSSTDFLSNCIAIFPIEDPEIILYIVIEKAKGETYAGRIVAPVIAEAADAIINHLGMSRGSAESLLHSGRIVIPAGKTLAVGSLLPDFTNMSKRDLLPLFDDGKFRVTIHGNGWVTSQTPPAGTPVTENMVIELNLE
ncbi:penicillin-binding protein [Treponema sp. Marseille-Q4523]|uniref:penicillin-binding protein n=1 Tax=Treponema sp. Marseille-Q4523 TaxID=2810610 RepID=UPI00195FAFBD|nr:penicillin-binding protein [Treponema sp. Marseille-Q4523]MBM7023583.1 transpeptidase family protein [Treponema sp. Marseille-Q4523]